MTLSGSQYSHCKTAALGDRSFACKNLVARVGEGTIKNVSKIRYQDTITQYLEDTVRYSILKKYLNNIQYIQILLQGSRVNLLHTLVQGQYNCYLWVIYEFPV